MSCVDAYSLKLSTSGTSSDFLEYKSTQWREVTIAFLLGQASEYHSPLDSFHVLTQAISSSCCPLPTHLKNLDYSDTGSQHPGQPFYRQSK